MNSMVVEWRRPTKDTDTALGEESLFPNVIAYRIAYHYQHKGYKLRADEPYHAHMIDRLMKRDINSLPYWITPLL